MANALPAVPTKCGYPKCWQMSPGLLSQSDAELFLMHEEFFGACCSFTVTSSKLVWNCFGALPVNTAMEYLTGRGVVDVRVLRHSEWVLCWFLTAFCLGCCRSHFRIASLVGKCFAWCFPQSSARAEVPGLPCLPVLTRAAPWECSLFSNSPMTLANFTSANVGLGAELRGLTGED